MKRRLIWFIFVFINCPDNSMNHNQFDLSFYVAHNVCSTGQSRTPDCRLGCGRAACPWEFDAWLIPIFWSAVHWAGLKRCRHTLTFPHTCKHQTVQNPCAAPEAHVTKGVKHSQLMTSSPFPPFQLRFWGWARHVLLQSSCQVRSDIS